MLKMRSVLAALALLPWLGRGAAAEPPQLDLPIACEIGRSCVVQNYVDRDPSPQAKDFACGTLTYDGHSGTDFRVATLEAQRAGVDVLAAADGVVSRARDGVPDVSIRDPGAASVKGTECGNGLLVEHGDGWDTQYCHMAMGSLVVKPGDRVVAGQKLGRVGLSGNTEYPHLHLTVRHRGQVVDPFAYGAAEASCGGGASLWRASVRQALAYTPGAVLNAGFATGRVTAEAIETGEAARLSPGPDAPAVVAWVRAIGLKTGDVQRIVIEGPAKRSLVEHTAKPLDRPKAQVVLFAGKPRPREGWERGTYRAVYTVLREGQVALERAFEVTL